MDFRKYFHADLDQGRLFWAVRKSRVTPGQEAGTIVTGGYRRVLIDKKSYAVHKILWWFATGTWPEYLDHINLCKSDNRLSNLRVVTHSENCLNKPLQQNNSSGYKGIHFRKSTGKWVLQMRRKGRESIRESFYSLQQAVDRKRELELDFYGQTYLSDKYIRVKNGEGKPRAGYKGV